MGRPLFTTLGPEFLTVNPSASGLLAHPALSCFCQLTAPRTSHLVLPNLFYFS